MAENGSLRPGGSVSGRGRSKPRRRGLQRNLAGPDGQQAGQQGQDGVDQHVHWTDLFRRSVMMHAAVEGKPFIHRRIHDALTTLGIGQDQIDLIGVMEGGKKWQIRFSSSTVADQLIREEGTLRVQTSKVGQDGYYECPVTRFYEEVHSLRVHWMPSFIPQSVLEGELKKYTSSIKCVVWETGGPPDHHIYMGTQVVVFTVEEDRLDNIPDTIDLNFDNKVHTVLLTVTGLAPRCHKCGVRGHIRSKCKTVCGVCGEAHPTERHEDHTGENAAAAQPNPAAPNPAEPTPAESVAAEKKKALERAQAKKEAAEQERRRKQEELDARAQKDAADAAAKKTAEEAKGKRMERLQELARRESERMKAIVDNQKANQQPLGDSMLDKYLNSQAPVHITVENKRITLGRGSDVVTTPAPAPTSGASASGGSLPKVSTEPSRFSGGKPPEVKWVEDAPKPQRPVARASKRRNRNNDSGTLEVVNYSSQPARFDANGAYGLEPYGGFNFSAESFLRLADKRRKLGGEGAQERAVPEKTAPGPGTGEESAMEQTPAPSLLSTASVPSQSQGSGEVPSQLPGQGQEKEVIVVGDTPSQSTGIHTGERVREERMEEEEQVAQELIDSATVPLKTALNIVSGRGKSSQRVEVPEGGRSQPSEENTGKGKSSQKVEVPGADISQTPEEESFKLALDTQNSGADGRIPPGQEKPQSQMSLFDFTDEPDSSLLYGEDGSTTPYFETEYPPQVDGASDPPPEHSPDLGTGTERAPVKEPEDGSESGPDGPESDSSFRTLPADKGCRSGDEEDLDGSGDSFQTF